MNNLSSPIAIIGSGLTGLTLGAALSQRGFTKISLFEGLDTTGGIHRPITQHGQNLNNGLRHIPVTSSSIKAMEQLESLLNLKLIQTITDQPPLTFESGSLRPFVGFGDTPVEFYEEIAPYFNSQSFQFHIEPSLWPQHLLKLYTGSLHTKSYITRLQQLESGSWNLTINGGKTVTVETVIYTGSVRSLPVLLGDLLPFKVKNKLTKNKYWTAVCLDLFHGSKVTEETALHVLNGTTSDELGPCIGKFLPCADTASNSQENSIQTSQWLTLLDEEVSEESELLAQALKKIKRQIKRAYPQSLEALKGERIIIVPSYAGTGELRLQDNKTLRDLGGLYLASSALSSERGLIGGLQQAFEMLMELTMGQSNQDPIPQTPHNVDLTSDEDRNI